MLAGTKQHLWKELLTEATHQELAWMNGFLSGLLSLNAVKAPVTASSSAKTSKITIAFGTETGNSKGLATRLAALAKKKGVIVKLTSLEQYKPEDLSKGGLLYIIISTQGDGEPPAAAMKFYNYVLNKAQALHTLQYGVLALGDTSYPLFCKAGEDIDHHLEIAGATRFLSLLKCDTDFETAATNWFEQSLLMFNQTQPVSEAPSTPIPKIHSGKKTYTGTVATHVNLNDRGSSKETYHIEIETLDVNYEPGDSIGILPENDDSQVVEILALTGASSDKLVTYKNGNYNLQQLLKRKLNIAYLPERTVKSYAILTGQDIPETKMALADILKIYPVKYSSQFEEVLQLLEPITPRLYSISSSPIAHTGEIHITVSRNTYKIDSLIRFGLCSDFLSAFAPGKEVSFFIHPNTLFRLPLPQKDLILIGPGTGIAPFRSFLAEREAIGANGRNWLFFGDQHFVSDFLYQTEIQSWYETGLLTRVNVAFSRDQQEKIYVQHKMEEQGAAFFEWLESGAYVYICGSKDPMSTDVEKAILSIIKTHGNYSQAAAVRYLEDLKESGRYLKDVY